MPLTIPPAVEADLPAIVSIVLAADADHPPIALPFASPVERFPFWLQRVSTLFHQPRSHAFVAAADETGELWVRNLGRVWRNSQTQIVPRLSRWNKQKNLPYFELRESRESEVRVF